VVKTFSELPHEVREQLHVDREEGVMDRQIEITPAGRIVLIKTAREIEEERIRKQRHAKLLAEIAALEGSENLPERALKKLAELRSELAKYEPADPTAVSLEAKRANASIGEGL
jgi:hypothetical protein